MALTLDKVCDYNSCLTAWHANREVMAHTFSTHNFSFKWSYAEMAPLIVGLGYDWALEQTAKCIGELVALVGADANDDAGGLFAEATADTLPRPPVTITCKPGDSLDHIADGTIDLVVMDPPYYDNVMYAELSDFFYVWLKRTAGHVFPELFRSHLTDKDNEAVANPARFRDQKGAKALAERDYQERMAPASPGWICILLPSDRRWRSFPATGHCGAAPRARNPSHAAVPDGQPTMRHGIPTR